MASETAAGAADSTWAEEGAALEGEMLLELQALEGYRRAYQAEHPSAHLDRHDPDVQRLIEACALFSVRSRRIARERIASVWRRLFGSYFDYLMTPLPAAAMAQVNVSPRLVEAVDLPRGTELRLTTAEGRVGIFTTRADLRVLPLTSEGLQLHRSSQGSRLVLSLRARFPRAEVVGALPILVSCQDDYLASLRVWHGLRKHLRRVIAVYDEVADLGTEGLPCAARFGSAEDRTDPAGEEGGAVNDMPVGDELSGAEHPIARLRAFFHFPDEALFLHVTVPPSARPFTRLSLCLDLDPEWSRDPALGQDALQLNCVPIANVVAGAAEPIRCDGTAASYPLRHPDPALRLQLHSIRGVYRVTPDGMRPLLPAALCQRGSDESFELEEPRPGAAPRLGLRLPRALLSPETVVAEALWQQPDFAAAAGGRLQLTMSHRRIDGVEWDLRAGLRPPAPTPLSRGGDELLSLLALRTRPTLSRPQLLQVLDLLLPAQGPYRRLAGRMLSLRVAVQPDGLLRGSGLQHAYHAAFDVPPDDDEAAALLHVFLRRLRELLDVWNADAAVTLTADAGGRPLVLPP